MATPSSDVFARLPLLAHAGKICLAITGSTPEQMQANAAAHLPEFPFQEIRLDYLPEPKAAIARFAPFLDALPEALFLATCRPERSGGQLRGSGEAEVDTLLEAAGAGFRIVDLSLETAEELGPEILERLRARGAAVQLSFHDFSGSGDLAAVLSRMHPFAPDLYKVVPTARTLGDSLQLLSFLRSSKLDEALNLVAMSMGEAGLITRVLGPRNGSAFTFAAATEAEATAPGQLTARTLTDLYRIGNLSPTTRLYGVAGDPIRSSLSPLMLNTAFRETSTDAVYLPLKTNEPDELFRVAKTLPLQGFSITMPLKQTVLPLLDHVDPLAARIGAVNTVHRQADGRLHGYNTDAAGIVVPLESRTPLRGARVLVLGAGGAARAAVFGCADRGAHVSVLNRTEALGQALAAEAGVRAISRQQLSDESFDVLINATPAGMQGNSRPLPLEPEELRAELVFDLVYNPLETPLLTLAREQGRQVIPGVEMFIHQGAKQFEIWTDKAAPVAEMQAVVLEALKRR